MKTLKDAEVSGKRVLVRTGMDIPVDKFGKITDDSRIIAAVPTIRYLAENNAKVILLTHMGRPDGQVIEALRVKNTAVRLSKLIGKKVGYVDDCIGKKVEEKISKMKKGDVIFLENLRFYNEETSRGELFAKKLASLGDLYVNDAFSNSHRDSASMTTLPRIMPSFAGLLLEKEVNALNRLADSPQRPYIAVLGGGKVSDKIKLIESLLKKVDKLLIGGAMAFTFLKAGGVQIGNSRVENDFVDTAKSLLKSGKIVLQADSVVAKKLDDSSECKTVIGNIDCGWLGLDIGPKTVEIFSQELKKAKTIVWNGPMGVFEIDRFSKGTGGVAKAIASSNAYTVIGGGDTLSAAKKAGVEGKFSHSSTGGGAMLEFLEGKKLPAIEALK